MHGKHDALARYEQRRQVAILFQILGVRPSVIARWTGLSIHQLETLREKGGVPPAGKGGFSPQSFEPFFRNASMRASATLFAAIYGLLGGTGHLSGVTDSRRLPGLAMGMAVLDAFLVYLACGPPVAIDFEQALLLAQGCIAGTRIAFERCRDCPMGMLVDRQGSALYRCELCREGARRRG